MSTTCPNCGHKFILRRHRHSTRVARLAGLDVQLISNPDGIIETDRILKAIPEWSKETMWDVCSAMVRAGLWARLEGTRNLKGGRYVKIRDIPRQKYETNRSDKRERMALR